MRINQEKQQKIQNIYANLNIIKSAQKPIKSLSFKVFEVFLLAEDLESVK